jgi:hypothetical protein
LPKTKAQDHHRLVYGASYLMAIALEVQGCFVTFPRPKVTSRSTQLNGAIPAGEVVELSGRLRSHVDLTVNGIDDAAIPLGVYIWLISYRGGRDTSKGKSSQTCQEAHRCSEKGSASHAY